jgi:hypothetical protein
MLYGPRATMTALGLRPRAFKYALVHTRQIYIYKVVALTVKMFVRA